MPVARIGAGNKALLNGSVTSASLLTVNSHAERTAKATVQATAVGLAGVNLSESEATISSDANTDAIVGLRVDHHDRRPRAGGHRGRHQHRPGVHQGRANTASSR